MSGADVLVKICGLVRPEDARAADAAGADFLGVVASAGFRRSVAPAAAGALVAGTRARRVAVLVDETAEAAEAAATAIAADVIQLHGTEEPEVLRELRRRGDWKLWKAIRARSVEDVRAAVARFGELVDALLLEGWSEGVTGGGGVRLALDPAGVRAALAEGPHFVLAGGLRPDSVGDAITAFRPGVVDVSSGVERVVGEKDPELVRRFLTEARAAGRSVAEGLAS